MDSEARTRELRTVDFDHLTKVGATATVVTVGLQLALHLWLFDSPLREISLWRLAVWIVGLTVVHEVVHGLGYLRGGARWSEVEFGFEWRKMAAWAGCRTGLAVEDYALALLLPLLVTGLLPWALGLFLQLPEVALAGAFLTSAAAGDVLMWVQTRPVPRGTTVYDAEAVIGFEVERA